MAAHFTYTLLIPLCFAFIEAHGTVKKQGPVTERSEPKSVPVSADPEAGNISILPGTSEGKAALVAFR